MLGLGNCCILRITVTGDAIAFLPFSAVPASGVALEVTDLVTSTNFVHIRGGKVIKPDLIKKDGETHRKSDQNAMTQRSVVASFELCR